MWWKCFSVESERFSRTFSSRDPDVPSPDPPSLGCISSTVRKSFSDVCVRKPISAFGCRPYRYGDSGGRAPSMYWDRSRERWWGVQLRSSLDTSNMKTHSWSPLGLWSMMCQCRWETITDIHTNKHKPTRAFNPNDEPKILAMHDPAPPFTWRDDRKEALLISSVLISKEMWESNMSITQNVIKRSEVSFKLSHLNRHVHLRCNFERCGITLFPQIIFY